MFLHCFKYTFLDFIRNKAVVFWVIFFPMILGTLFNFAFMGIYDNEEKFSELSAAVVNGCEEGGVKQLIEGMSGDTKFIKAQYVDEEKAIELLKSSEVDGIIYDDVLEPTLTVRSGGGIRASILKTFIDRYKANALIISDAVMTAPEKLPALIDAMQAESVESLNEKQLSSGSMNVYTTYFYNLLAMACMFVSMIGMTISINQQANLSAVGARKSVSPAGKAAQTTAGIAAALVIFYAGIAIATAYLFFVLDIDFGISYGEVLIINFFGVLMGLSMGFFVGSIGRMSENAKLAVLLLVSMGTGLLSGLMAGDMPVIIEKNCPIVNRINPSHLISDSFYAVNSYGWGDRVLRNIISLLIISALLITGGCLLTRKRRFKSL